MNVNIGQVIVWIIVGALAGTLAARLLRQWRRGYGFVGNTILGLIGAVIGGIIFQALDIGPWFPELAITLDDVIVAFIGAVIFLLLLGFIRRL